MERLRSGRHAPLLLLLTISAILSGAGSALLGTCGPFTDVAADTFCPFVLEIFTIGITTGTTATTYNPAGNVSRLQMAAFLSRSVDTSLKRATRRVAMNQLWTPKNASVLGLTTVGVNPHLVQFDGASLWVANHDNGTVSRVRRSDARLLETWTGATGAVAALTAMNRVLVGGGTSPGRLYAIDPSQAAGAVTTVASNLGAFPSGIAFDGQRVWTTNANFSPGTISIVTPGAIPWTVTTVSLGGGSTVPVGVLYDGANIWVTDGGLGTLVKLDGSGAVLQTVTVGQDPDFPGFDGTNIWVPNNQSPSVTVVRASNGTVLQTLTGNGLANPFQAGFDGERILVTNAGNDSVSLWKAADLTPLGSFPVGAHPFGVSSDGIRFWITLSNAGNPGWLARF